MHRSGRDEIARIGARLLDEVRAELALPPEIVAELACAAPLLVSDLDAAPSYWLVPLAAGDSLAGFVRIDLDGQVMAWGRWGQGSDPAALPRLSVLSEETAERELRRAFGESHRGIGPAGLVHDGAVEKIAWRARARSPDGEPWLLFWTFGSAYSRPADEPRDPLLL